MSSTHSQSRALKYVVTTEAVGLDGVTGKATLCKFNSQAAESSKISNCSFNLFNQFFTCTVMDRSVACVPWTSRFHVRTSKKLLFLLAGVQVDLTTRKRKKILLIDLRRT